MATVVKMAGALAGMLLVDAAAVPAISDPVCNANDSASQCPNARSNVADNHDHLLLQVAPARHTFTSRSRFAWDTSGEVVAANQWCRAEAPADSFTLKHCSADGGAKMEVRVLSYNLYWWNLFGPQFRNGNGGSAGRLIAQHEANRAFDFMGFQECDDIGRVLGDAGLSGAFGAVKGEHAVAIAYRQSAWSMLEHGSDEVAEDRQDQWWGTRGAQWARFKSTTSDKTVLFVNHHGPLPVGTGGVCGPRATAFNILRTIASHAQTGDGIILVGDFNSDAGTEEIREISHRLHKVHTGVSFGGVDHIFSNCGDSHVKSHNNLGDGGSDHEAVDAVIEL